MAAKQQQIKNELNKLQNSQNNSKELTKQIEDLKRLMNQSENDLINKRTNNNLVKRQQVIQVKLLEVEKASKQQEYDNKRESKVAQTVQSKYPPALENYLKDKQNQIELIKTIPPNFTPYYKEEINRYYNRIR
jgi:septal ring factor EnvC (AmiA/AmiB activator)